MEGWWPWWELDSASLNLSPHARGRKFCYQSEPRLRWSRGDQESGPKVSGDAAARDSGVPSPTPAPESLQRASAKLRLQLSVCTCKVKRELCLYTQVKTWGILVGWASTSSTPNSPAPGSRGQMSNCKEEMETRKEELQRCDLLSAGAEARWGMLHDVAPTGSSSGLLERLLIS